MTLFEEIAMVSRPTNEQRTTGWYRARLGHFTGSKVGELMTKGRGKDEVFGKTAMTYIRQVAAERLLSDTTVNTELGMSAFMEAFNATSKSMQYGIENENDARELYSQIRDVNVSETGSVRHPLLENFASSPDGIVMVDNGCIEIKCINPSLAVEYLGASSPQDIKAINSDYYWQCLAHMACVTADYCDFITYMPFFKDKYQLHVVRFTKVELMDDIKALEEKVALAENMVTEIISRL